MSMSPHERYCRDVEFKTLVDMIESMIQKCEYTPTELREAVILAAIHYDTKNPSPMLTMVRPAPRVSLLQEELNLQRDQEINEIEPYPYLPRKLLKDLE